MKEIVVDASVVLRWFLPDEEGSEKVLGILRDLVSGEYHLFAPQLLFYEVMNGLLVAQRRGRVEEGTVLMALEGFMDLGVELVDISPLGDEICRLCLAYHCSAYDGSYLALAESREASFVTADRKLYDKVKKSLDWVEFLGE